MNDKNQTLESCVGMTKHTPGPWRWEFNKEHRSVHLVGGKPQFDLTIIDFCRWGMNGATMRLRDTAHDGYNLMHDLHKRPDWIAPQPGREHHKSWHQLVTHPDARLIEAAPDLLEALKLADCLLSGANMNRDVVQHKVHAAIAKAEGITV
jgi:hypothetical protein